MVPGEFGHLPEYREVTGTPPGSQWALLGLSGREEGPARWRAPPKPNPNWVGGRPPLSVPLSPSSFFSYSNKGRGWKPTPTGSRTPPLGAPMTAGPPLLHSFIYGGGGTP